MKSIISLFTAVCVLLMPALAGAVPVLYSGVDAGAVPGDPLVNADAAAAAFDGDAGALGTVNLIDLESLSTGYTANVALDGNTLATFSGQIDPSYSGITAGDDPYLGYNTTPGGRNHLRFAPEFGWDTARLTLSFINPVQAFGAYFTGLETEVNGMINVLFDDGVLQSYTLPEGAGGGASFWGFTDAGKSVSAIILDEVNQGSQVVRDIWGIDDIRYVINDADGVGVPAPATLLLLGVGLLGVSAARRARSN